MSQSDVQNSTLELSCKELNVAKCACACGVRLVTRGLST